MIEFDATGIDPTETNFRTLPEKQWFDFKIVEAEQMKSRSGNDMVRLKVEVINNPEWNQVSLLHFVSFIPKGNPGAGISVHFLKSIGQPFEGDLAIDADDWLGKKFKATTIVEEYVDKNNNKKMSSRIKLIDLITAVVEEEVPF